MVPLNGAWRKVVPCTIREKHLIGFTQNMTAVICRPATAAEIAQGKYLAVREAHAATCPAREVGQAL